MLRAREAGYSWADIGTALGVSRQGAHGERHRPLGTIFASIKDHDGPNDKASQLSRPGVYRFAFQLTRNAFVDRFGTVPARPSRGGVVALDLDPSALDELTPHPVYAWMRWVQILSPTARQFDALRPALEESLSLVKTKWQRRRPGQRVRETRARPR